MNSDPPKVAGPLEDRSGLLLDHLDHLRSGVAAHCSSMSEATMRTSILPSGWTPIELLQHLVAMEQRWLVWGFEGRSVDDPWFDWRDGRWFVDESTDIPGLLQRLESAAVRTRRIVESHPLEALGAPGPRWDGEQPAALERVLLHVLQEYARHLGHLDIVRELAEPH